MNPIATQPYVKIMRKKTVHKADKSKSEELIKKMRKEHDKLVKGMFEFLDAQGGWLDFSYRVFPDEDVMTFHLIHGQIYELPLGVVKHLNNTRKKIRKLGNGDPTRATEILGRGVPSTYEVQSRVRFTPTDVIL